MYLYICIYMSSFCAWFSIHLHIYIYIYV
jgi:hypothetical protein